MSKLNLQIDFPIILLVDNRYMVFQDEKRYTIMKKSHIEKIQKIDEFVIDSAGIKYKRIAIEPQKNINIFGGFHVLYGFGTCYAKITLRKIEQLSIDQLKTMGLDIIHNRQHYFSETLLPIERWQREFVGLHDRDEILRYMFYFTDTSRYCNPDLKDLDWRKREGFVKKK